MKSYKKNRRIARVLTELFTDLLLLILTPGGGPSPDCCTQTKTEAKDENEQAHHDNRHRWHQPRGISDIRQRGTIAENRLFGRDRWRGAEIVCGRRRCVAHRE